MTLRLPLPNRRASHVAVVEYEGLRYRVSFGCYPDGKLGELFINVGKPDAAIQAHADDAGVLVSLLLQYGVAPAVIRRSLGGPVGKALDLWLAGQP